MRKPNTAALPFAKLGGNIVGHKNHKPAFSHEGILFGVRFRSNQCEDGSSVRRGNSNAAAHVISRVGQCPEAKLAHIELQALFYVANEYCKAMNSHIGAVPLGPRHDCMGRGERVFKEVTNLVVAHARDSNKPAWTQWALGVSSALFPAARKMNHVHRIFSFAPPGPFFGNVIFVFETEDEPLFVSNGGLGQIAGSGELEI